MPAHARVADNGFEFNFDFDSKGRIVDTSKPQSKGRKQISIQNADGTAVAPAAAFGNGLGLALGGFAAQQGTVVTAPHELVDKVCLLWPHGSDRMQLTECTYRFKLSHASWTTTRTRSPL